MLLKREKKIDKINKFLNLIKFQRGIVRNEYIKTQDVYAPALFTFKKCFVPVSMRNFYTKREIISLGKESTLLNKPSEVTISFSFIENTDTLARVLIMKENTVLSYDYIKKQTTICYEPTNRYGELVWLKTLMKLINLFINKKYRF